MKFKVQVILQFTLSEYDKIKDTIERKNIESYGKLYVGDRFICDENMVKYLTKDNDYNKSFVKIIEIIPEIK